MNNNIKLYLVRFTDKGTSDTFYKMGITSRYDVLERFDSDQYNNWDIKVMSSAYGPREEVERAEKVLLELYPKNLWIEQKISGVTEIARMSRQEFTECMALVKDYSAKWYALRH